MTKPTVALLHYSCPPVIGGVEFVLEAHAALFADAGFPVRVIVGKGEIERPGVKTHLIPEIVSRGGPLSSVLKGLNRGEVPPDFERAVRRVEKKLSVALRGVDVCMIHNVLTMHFNLVLTAALANLMKADGRTRFIGWTHDASFLNDAYAAHQHRRYPWTLLSQALPGCDYCVISVQRQKELRTLFRVPTSRLPVIPDGVDVPRFLGFTSVVKELFHTEQMAAIDVVALTPARIVRRKNLGVGLEIVAALKKRGVSVRWLITGAPDPHNRESMQYYRMLRALRRRMNLKEEVIFLCERFPESVSSRDLRALYRMSDILLFPSEQEGFGLPVIEAGLVGRLCVVSDIPALREIAGPHAVYIRHGDGPPKVAGRILSALKRNFTLTQRREIISHYSWDVVFRDKILPAVRHPGTVWKSHRIKA